MSIDLKSPLINQDPTRINYYERYQKIIEEYNAEQDKTLIEKTFIDLMNFVNDLNNEGKRYACEGFDNDEESYDEYALSAYRQRIFEFVYPNYPAA